MLNLIRKLLKADRTGDIDTMHDVIVVLIFRRIITMFRLFQMEHRLQYLNAGPECHGDRELVRWYVTRIVSQVRDRQSMFKIAEEVRNILYITSHQAWALLFANIDIGQSFPPKSLQMCHKRTQKPQELSTLQTEILQYGIEQTILHQGKIQYSKKRAYNKGPNFEEPEETFIIKRAVRQLTSC